MSATFLLSGDIKIGIAIPGPTRKTAGESGLSKLLFWEACKVIGHESAAAEVEDWNMIMAG
jgi:hypothetical protein